MLNLAEYRKKPQRLADFLPWAALVAPGVVLNKDGSFQRTARFRGPDLDSATPAELVGDAGAAQQRAAPARLRLGDLCRGAAGTRHRTIREPAFPDPGLGAGRSERRATVRGRGRAFREPLLPDLRLAAAGRGGVARARAGSTRAARSRASMGESFSRRALPIAPTASCSSSKASCPKPPGSMTKRR